MNDFLFESSFLLVSFDFFFAKEGNDLLEFCFLSVVVVVVVVVIAANKSGVRSRLFFVRRSRPRSSSDDDDDDGNIPLQGERENFCGLERTNERDLSSVSEYERSTQKSNVSTTYALKP